MWIFTKRKRIFKKLKYMYYVDILVTYDTQFIIYIMYIVSIDEIQIFKVRSYLFIIYASFG